MKLKAVNMYVLKAKLKCLLKSRL